jgi:4-diphosphocytidyl-2-C-methyl-D-erythritol kinase
MADSVSAIAKINLYLDVLGRRPDGYHEIATVFMPLTAPVDVITLTAGDPGELTVVCAHPGVPDGPGNLCWKAAAAFAREARLEPAWRVDIAKHIPVAAGLGGGSSDAAAVLLALHRRYPAAVPPGRLAALAAQLGADVPFFLRPEPALGRGIGEVLTPVACAGPLEVVLVNAGFPVPAAWAYAQRGRVAVPSAPALADLLAALAEGSLATVAPLTYNALEYAVLDKFPLVRLLRDALLEQGCRCAHVSGSGPTVYGLCPAGEGPAIAARVQALYGAAVWVCATVAAAGSAGAERE